MYVSTINEESYEVERKQGGVSERAWREKMEERNDITIQ